MRRGLFLLTIATGATTAMAQGTAAPTPEQQQGFWSMLADNAVGLTILLIFITAILAALIKSRKRDRVLKSFNGYQVTAVLKDGRRIYGRFVVYPNGVEFDYSLPCNDPSGHVESSFILHQNEFVAVRAFLRLRDRLTPEMLAKRQREVLRYVSPTIFRRIWRFAVIQFAILRDAILQAFSILVGAASRTASTASRFGSVLRTQDKQITQIGSTVMGAITLTNDPILESLFGRSCVVEVKEGDAWREIPCYLKEYSADWLELLRASWPLQETIRLKPAQTEAAAGSFKITLRRDKDDLVLENGEGNNVEVLRVKVGKETKDLARLEVRPGQQQHLPVSAREDEEVVLELLYLEPADIVVPRGETIVRHRGAKESLSFMENLGLRKKA
jgi:hypothetical protein